MAHYGEKYCLEADNDDRLRRCMVSKAIPQRGPFPCGAQCYYYRRGSMKKGMPAREGAGRPPKKKEEKAPSPAPSPPRTPPRERSKSPERSKTPPHERNKELEGLSPYERYWMMQNGQCR